MRVRQLHLTAYGPFTNETIDLGGGHPGLHVIVGPNGAGRTSVCAALTDLYFGIENQTAYNFVHDYRDMEIGATLDLGGQTLELCA